MINNFFEINGPVSLLEDIVFDRVQNSRLENKILVVFMKTFHKTRISFTTGINQLGGRAIDFRFKN